MRCYTVMAIFNKMKLGIKLPIFLGSILALLLLSTSFGYFGLRQNSDYFEQYEKIVNQTVLAGRIQANLLESRIAFKNFNEFEEDTNQLVFENRFSKMQTFIDQLKATTDRPDHAQRIEIISLKAKEYRDDFHKVVEYKSKMNNEYSNLNTIGSEMEETLSKIMQSAYEDKDEVTVSTVGNAQKNLLTARLNMEKYLKNNDQKAIQIVRTQLSELEDLLNTTNNQELSNLIGKDEIYSESFIELVSVIESNKSTINGMDIIGAEIATSAEEIKLSLIKEQDTYGPMVEKNNNYSIYGMFALSLLAIILAVLISLEIIKMIVVPVRTVTNTFKDISEGEGDLTVRLKVFSTDELGDMAAYFNKFMEKLEVIMHENKNQTWLKTGQTELSGKTGGDQDIMTLGNNIISFVSKYLNAQIGAIYHLTEDKLKLMGSYAYSRRKNLSNEINIGEGLVGQAVLEKQTIIITNIPDNYIKVHSGIGESAPLNIIVTPCIYNSEIKCVLELGLFQEVSEIQQDFIELVAESIAIAIHSTEARTKMQTLLNKSLQQSEELQVQQEELRQSNEELEQQTMALKESELNMNAQQEELRVINEELEEHTKSLELQQKDISLKNTHLINAQKEIEDKAKALETASKYKSEFLANVSHELRTPLNSILVLSQLLANKTDKSPLTDKQLEFAKTIHSSGTDLLKLINDVLDLSKVEAGKMDVNFEDMSLAELLDNVERSFRQIALEKGLDLTINLDGDLPNSISMDTQKVQQIVNNLVSNAFKFTKKGGITINVSRPDKGDYPELETNNSKLISIAIRDTGIGIPPEKQSLIFEAFRQSDGTTSREYGGTGLGLSISKELARLLRGTINLRSEVGIGSTFTFVFTEKLLGYKELNQNHEVFNTVGIAKSAESNEGDNTVNLDVKSLLIIDDDQNFSKVLAELAHEKGFSCLIADDGETGIQLAIKHKPKAILLDLGLPGISGWEVMEQLKHHIETKNIPIHIISGQELTTNESEKGIVGYLRKPVTVEIINSMFRSLGDLETKQMKKLLILTIDETQRKSITELIGSKGVAISIVDTGQEAYELLKKEHFDCMILDMKLRDMSGYDLLTKLREEKGQVPIIILADHEFIEDNVDPIKSYGESIIIKGSRSMERLVAEVSLFLHDVDANGLDIKHTNIRKCQEKGDSLDNKKVLIVDDDMRNVFALTSALEEKGMHVIIGKNGREGIEKLNQNPDLDLILMDIMMPEMDGYEAMKKIRSEEKFRKTPIIALTAKAMKEDKNKCIEAGANDYLTKPIELDKLMSLLRVWLYK